MMTYWEEKARKFLLKRGYHVYDKEEFEETFSTLNQQCILQSQIITSLRKQVGIFRDTVDKLTKRR